MNILFTKRYQHKDTNGSTIYPPNATLPVTDAVAIGAALAGATDDPEALAMAAEYQADDLAGKALSKMTKPELLDEIARLTTGEPDATRHKKITDNIQALEQEVKDLTAERAALQTDLATANAKVELAGTVSNANDEAMSAVIAAYNAAAPDSAPVESLAQMTEALTELATTPAAPETAQAG